MCKPLPSVQRLLDRDLDENTVSLAKTIQPRENTHCIIQHRDQPISPIAGRTPTPIPIGVVSATPRRCPAQEEDSQRGCPDEEGTICCGGLRLKPRLWKTPRHYG